MKSKINKKTAYIFTELNGKILTKYFLDMMEIKISQVKQMQPNEVEDLFYDVENETERFLDCEECGKIHSRTYEGCETEVSEFFKFYNQPKQIFLDTI